MVAKRSKIWKRCKKSEKDEETNTVEVITSAQEGILAAQSRTTVRAKQSTESVNLRSIPASVEIFLLQASGVRWFVGHGRPLLSKHKMLALWAAPCRSSLGLTF